MPRSHHLLNLSSVKQMPVAGSKCPAHQPQRPLGLACSPRPRPTLGKHPAGPQLPSNGWYGPSPPVTTIPTPRLWAIQRLSQEGTIHQSYPSLEVLFQPGLQAQRPAQPTKVFRVSHPPPLTPDLKVPREADVFRPLAFFLFSTNFQHQLEAAIKTPGLAVLRLSIST